MTAALGAATVVVLSATTAGLAELASWFGALSEHAGRTLSADGSNQGLAAAVARLAPSSRASTWTTASGAALLLGTVVNAMLAPRRRPRRIDATLRIGNTTAATLLALPLSWDHYQILLIPGGIVFAMEARRQPAAWTLFLAGATFLALHRFWRPLFGVVPHPFAQALGVAGVAMWWIAGLWLLNVRSPQKTAVRHV
jgi:hypothetical protein